MLNFSLFNWRTTRSPRRAKERAAELVRTGGARNLTEVQAEVRAILADLVSKNLVLKDAADHNDRAHAYRLLGDLHRLQMNFIESEKNYRAAVDCYNDALKLEADNQIAISSKFNTVESINEIERSRF
jgi:tetratricopeptide (TPR) repeat protein